ncbi:MAG: MMPL family transporter, partial [Planctomycetota bacterium]
MVDHPSKWWIAPLCAVVLLLATLPFAFSLQTQQQITQLFPPDSADLAGYRQLQNTFGGNAVVMIVYRDESMATSEGLQRVRQISRRVSEVEGVRGVLSLAELDAALRTMNVAGGGQSGRTLFGGDSGGLLGGMFSSARPQRQTTEGSSLAEPAGGESDGGEHENTPEIFSQRPIHTEFRSLFDGYTHSADLRWVCVVAMLQVADPSDADPAVQDQTISRLRMIADDLPDTPDTTGRMQSTDGYLVGEPVLVSEGFRMIRRDGNALTIYVILLLSVVIWIAFRHWWWVLCQLLMIVWSVIVTRGILAIIGLQLSLVSTMLMSILTVIAVASLVHWISRFERLRVRMNHGRAADRVFHEVFPPIFWACATDAAGFLSLSVSAVRPVREFGLMMAIAAMVVCAAFA